MQTAPANPFLQNQILSIKSSIVPVFANMAKNFVQSGTVGNVLDAAGDNSGRGGQLAVAGGLDPPPPLDVVVQSDQGLGESGAVGMSGRRREPRPPSAVSFGQGREAGVVELERVGVGPGAPGVLG